MPHACHAAYTPNGELQRAGLGDYFMSSWTLDQLDWTGLDCYTCFRRGYGTGPSAWCYARKREGDGRQAP